MTPHRRGAGLRCATERGAPQSPSGKARYASEVRLYAIPVTDTLCRHSPPTQQKDYLCASAKTITFNEPDTRGDHMRARQHPAYANHTRQHPADPLCVLHCWSSELHARNSCRVRGAGRAHACSGLGRMPAMSTSASKSHHSVRSQGPVTATSCAELPHGRLICL